MGLKTEANKDVDGHGRRGVGSPALAFRRPPLPTSSSAMSFGSSSLQSEGEGDDRVETCLPNALQNPGTASVIIPAITVKSEFSTISRKTSKSLKQTVSCLVTVQVPHAGKRERYSACSLSPTKQESQSLENIGSPTAHRPLCSDAASLCERATAATSSELNANSRHNTSGDPFSHIASDLKSRMADYKGSGIDNLGRIRLFDILKVRKGGVVLDISVYLFQHALVCVTEEKKKSLRGFLNSAPSYNSLRHQTPDEKGNKRDKGILKLKGRIYFKHVRRVVDTSISGELSLTISMEDENVDSFILAFKDQNSLELWRSTIIKAVQESKGDATQPVTPASPPISASASIASKLAKMGFEDSVVSATQHSPNTSTQGRLESMKLPGRTFMDNTSGNVHTDTLISAVSTPLLPVHTPLDLIIVCSVPPASVSTSTATLKIRLIKAALEHVCLLLGPYDRLSIVTYEHGTGGLVRKTPFLSPGRLEGRNKLERYLSTLGLDATKDTQPDMDSDGFTVPMDREARTDMVTGVNIGLDKVLQRTTKNPLAGMILIHDNSEAVKRAAMDLILARAETAK